MTAPYYSNFLENELSLHLKDVLLKKRIRLGLHHDGAIPHFGNVNFERRFWRKMGRKQQNGVDANVLHLFLWVLREVVVHDYDKPEARHPLSEVTDETAVGTLHDMLHIQWQHSIAQRPVSGTQSNGEAFKRVFK